MIALPTRSLVVRARQILRFNSYAAFGLAPLVLLAGLPGGARPGVGIVPLAGLAAAMALAAADGLLLAVGRRLRRSHLLGAATINAAFAGVCAGLAAGGAVAGAIMIAAAVSFSAFALVQAGAARSF